MEPLEGNMAEHRNRIVSTKQQRIAELAKQSPQMGFTSLTTTWTWTGCTRLSAHAQRRGTGRGRTNRRDYERDLGDNLRSLLDRAKSGTYRAPPVRRVHIPKGTGERNATDRDSDVGGQSASAGGGHAAGADLRAGLSGLFVWLSAGAVGAPGCEALWSRRWGGVVAGFWKWTSGSFSTLWIMPICGSFCSKSA